MTITLDRFTDAMYVNLIRQICMCRIPTLRPIAFKVGELSNVAEISPMVEEDMSEFISTVSSAVYRADGAEEIFSVSTKGDGEFRISSLCYSTVQLVKGDCAALHTHTPITVEVLFRKATGVYTEKENRDFLKAEKVDLDGWTVINSRHCAVKKFHPKKVKEWPDRVEYEISLVTDDSIGEEEILMEAFNVLKQDASKL